MNTATCCVFLLLLTVAATAAQQEQPTDVTAPQMSSSAPGAPCPAGTWRSPIGFCIPCGFGWFCNGERKPCPVALGTVTAMASTEADCVPLMCVPPSWVSRAASTVNTLQYISGRRIPHGPVFSSVSLPYPTGCAADALGSVYVGSLGDVWRLERGCSLAKVVDGADPPSPGPAGVRGVAVSPAGTAVFWAEVGLQSVVKRLDVRSGAVSVVAGGGASEDDGVPATQLQLTSPQGVAVDAKGNLYIADGSFMSVVVRVSPNGTASVVAGVRYAVGFNGDGPATEAFLNAPIGLSIDAAGKRLLIADSANGCIRQVDLARGLLSTVAGKCGIDPAPGRFNIPTAAVRDASGALLVSEAGLSRILRAAGSNVTVVAGGGSSSADGVPPTQAAITGLWGLCVDASRTLALYTEQGASPSAGRVRGFGVDART